MKEYYDYQNYFRHFKVLSCTNTYLGYPKLINKWLN